MKKREVEKGEGEEKERVVESIGFGRVCIRFVVFLLDVFFA